VHWKGMEKKGKQKREEGGVMGLIAEMIVNEVFLQGVKVFLNLIHH
jgi:hypothetical protein